MEVPDKVTRMLTAGGSRFHASVVRAFRGASWDVSVSPYYLDASSNKSREIDLVVEKSWDVRHRDGQSVTRLRLRLFVECKYVAQQSLLWFDRLDRSAARRWLCHHSPLRENNAYTDKHHYLSSSDEAAKLFESDPSGRSDRGSLYGAINQVLHAMVYLRGVSTINREDEPWPEELVELPVIVCNDFSSMWRTDVDGPEEASRIEDCFMLDVDYAYLSQQGRRVHENFLLDVVAFDQLQSFLGVLDEDVDVMKQQIFR